MDDLDSQHVPDLGEQPTTPEISVSEDVEYPSGERAPSEVFQALANEIRLRVLVRLFQAEREDGTPLSFSELQDAADTESSAGFAYHLRQLSGHFVRETADGYVLTGAGRRAADAVVTGTFTNRNDSRQAS